METILIAAHYKPILNRKRNYVLYMHDYCHKTELKMVLITTLRPEQNGQYFVQICVFFSFTFKPLGKKNPIYKAWLWLMQEF